MAEYVVEKSTYPIESEPEPELNSEVHYDLIRETEDSNLLQRNFPVEFGLYMQQFQNFMKPKKIFLLKMVKINN
jgi:hypothetical protein